jgi:hypothetical protein
MKIKKNELEIPTGKFKITSKLSGGQKVYFIHEGKITNGVISGYHHGIISNRNYISNNTQYEVKVGLDTYNWVDEVNCYTSQRALLIGIKK